MILECNHADVDQKHLLQLFPEVTSEGNKKPELMLMRRATASV